MTSTTAVLAAAVEGDLGPGAGVEVLDHPDLRDRLAAPGAELVALCGADSSGTAP